MWMTNPLRKDVTFASNATGAYIYGPDLYSKIGLHGTCKKDEANLYEVTVVWDDGIERWFCVVENPLTVWHCIIMELLKKDNWVSIRYVPFIHNVFNN